MTDRCDFCDAPITVDGNHRVVALPRPSDRTSMCSVMWGCGKCEASRELPTSLAVGAAISRGEYVGVEHWEG